MAGLRWIDTARSELRDATTWIAADGALVVTDRDGRLVGADERTRDVLGLEPESLLGRTPADLAWRLTRADGNPLPESDNPAVRAIATGEPVLDEVIGVEISREGLSTFAWYAVSAVPVRGHDGQVEGVATTLRDVSGTDAGRDATAAMARSLRELTQASAIDEARFRLLAENSADVVFQTDVAGRIVWMSPSVRDVLGWDADRLVGTSALPLLHPEDRERANELRRVALGSDGADSPSRLEQRFATSDGAWRWMSVLSRPMRDARGRVIGGLSALRDIQVEVEHREELRYLAGHDTLTGLLNRDAALHALRRALQAAQGSGRWVGLLYLDIDRFKDVNDTFGHEAGDRLLVEVGRRLTAALRESDVVARLGGDEFLVILTSLKERDHAASRARSLLGAVSAPSADGVPTATASIGVVADDGTGDPAAVITAADAALYRAKHAGRATVST